AYVAEQWGRRWITIDTSRVPLALARQRLLTATYSYYQLKDEKRGPAGGFVYVRKQNKKGEEVGGIVPHVTLKSIANNEPPDEEVLVDRPEVANKIVHVTGPFAVQATSPRAVPASVGPATGAIMEQLSYAALKAANLKAYTHLYVIAFAIQPHARDLIENASAVGLLPATYVQATPDLMMGDLLKNMRS